MVRKRKIMLLGNEFRVLRDGSQGSRLTELSRLDLYEETKENNILVFKKCDYSKNRDVVLSYTNGRTNWKFTLSVDQGTSPKAQQNISKSPVTISDFQWD
jgi:hypothetical protein